MDLVIIRHADAGERDPKKYPDDRLRPLSLDGRTDMLRVARGMRRLGITFDRIVDSGLVRARQTAECVCDAYEIDRASIATVEALAPEADPEETVAALRKLKGAKSVAAVGHQPQLGRLAGYLVASNPDLPIELKKAGVCLVTVKRWAAGGGVLTALITPKLLRRLGK